MVFNEHRERGTRRPHTQRDGHIVLADRSFWRSTEACGGGSQASGGPQKLTAADHKHLAGRPKYLRAFSPRRLAESHAGVKLPAETEAMTYSTQEVRMKLDEILGRSKKESGS